MSAIPKSEGVGLMLNRRVGSKVIIMGNPDATDEEVLEAIREGIVITVVGVDTGMHQKQKDNVVHLNDGNQKDGQIQRRHSNRGGIARIGIKAGSALYIAREELLLRTKKLKEATETI